MKVLPLLFESRMGVAFASWGDWMTKRVVFFVPTVGGEIDKIVVDLSGTDITLEEWEAKKEELVREVENQFEITDLLELYILLKMLECIEEFRKIFLNAILTEEELEDYHGELSGILQDIAKRLNANLGELKGLEPWQFIEELKRTIIIRTQTFVCRLKPFRPLTGVSEYTVSASRGPEQTYFGTFKEEERIKSLWKKAEKKIKEELQHPERLEKYILRRQFQQNIEKLFQFGFLGLTERLEISKLAKAILSRGRKGKKRRIDAD